MNCKDSTLDILRNNINEIDEKILILLSQRRSLSIEIAEIKFRYNRPVRDVEREQLLMERLVTIGKKYQLNSCFIIKLFQLIIEDSVLIQKYIIKKKPKSSYENNAIKITFLGPKGSYSHIAARKYFTRYFDNIIECSCVNFYDIIKYVEKGIADYAILPIENTSSGSINEVYDLLQNTNLSITHEITLYIDHCILSKKGTNLDEIKTIYSHSQPFQQCSNFIKMFPHWNIKYTESTAAAMKKVSELNLSTIAAVGSEVGGSLYNLQVLRRNLANQRYNQTRFIVLSRKPIEVEDHISAKTTIIIATGQRVGTLIDVLLVLRKYNLIINKIESRPINGNPWEEIFYIDIKNNLKSENMKRALKDLKNITYSLRILGCYPSEGVTSMDYNKTNKY
ncbi:bifunctional chorismate mutase/prephenate dehydratase [Pantoea sp. SoEX]|uniref:bifunctional chorismate mutase/prephenate dehydratase n=1 Tax=Pantoea sp. SoEX TaxID=2576763 RepID=UPI00135C3D4C|nr:bifunctional chorismate mutase/prephenate dehydratase [Pantoea sp. SoEX]MXP51247.1 bifunctional chorismate mutase/prephenate dehydratase [Pantoea sp. SoEX]